MADGDRVAQPFFKRAFVIGIVTLTGILTADASLAQENSASRRDSAGIEVVQNLVDDFFLPWTLSERLRLGSALDPDESFFRLDAGSVAFGPEGRLYVLDKGNYTIRVFEPDGTFVRKMGGKGGGRGELTHPITLHIAPNGTIRVLDFGKQSWTNFDASGRALDGHPIDDVRVFGWRLAWVEEGLVSGFRNGYRTSAGSVEDGLRLMSAIDTTVLGSVVKRQAKEQIYPECRMIIPLPPVFERTLEWGANGNIVAVNDDVGYAVDVYHGKRLVRRVYRDVVPETVGRAEAIESLVGRTQYKTPDGQKCEIAPSKMVDERGYEPVVQAISGIQVAPDGTLWIRRARKDSEARPPIDIISGDGEYLGTLPKGTPYPVAFDPSGNPVSIEEGEFDEEQVVIYDVVR